MMPASKRMGKRTKPSTKNRKLLPSHLIPTQTSTITALPNEIWSEVLSYLCKKYLKLLRLVGDRLLSSLASPQLFRTAYIAARRGVLDIFLKVTTHETIRHYIREVIFDGSWLNPPHGVVQTRSTRKGSYKMTSECTEMPLAKLFQEQEIIREKELLQSLKTAFQSLTAVKRVVFADLSRTAGLVGDSLDSDGGPLSHRTSSVIDPSSDFDSSTSYHSVSYDLNQDPYASYKEVCRRQYDGLSMLFHVLSRYAPTTLTELSLGESRHSSDEIKVLAVSQYVGCSFGGIPDWYFTPKTNHSLDTSLYDLFHRLKKLDLTISFPAAHKTHNSSKCPTSGGYAYLGDWLDVADKLEELRLCGHIDTRNLDFETVLSPRTFHRLQSLELRYCKATFLNLQEMLTRHKYSLKAISLDFFNLVGGSWSDLFDFVRSELPETKFVVGWTWQNGELVELGDEEDEDQAYIDPPERVSGEGCDVESSSDEEFDYSSGSEGSEK